MLDPALVGQLSDHLRMVTAPVTLVSSLDESAKSVELGGLLDQIAGLSDLLTHERTGTDPRRPSFRIERAGTEVAVAFAGIPLGHEFTSFVLALLQVGGHPPKVDPEVADSIRALPGPLHFETFMSLTCQNCPDVVQALNTMAVLNPASVTHIAIEGGVFPDDVAARGIQAVPAVYLNGEVFGHGRMTLSDILAKVDKAGGTRATARLAESEPYDALVVGGGPAGSSAAIYLARKGLRTGLVAERFGGQLLDTMAIENYPSVEHTEGPQLAAALERHVRSYGVDVVLGRRVAALEPAGEAGLHGIRLEDGPLLRARTVIVATGARWRTMGVPGEEAYRNRGVTFCPHCDGPLFKGRRVAVIGGGNSGVEAAIDLAGVVEHVTVVEFLDDLRADEVLQDRLRGLPNADILLGRRTTEVLGDGTRVTGLAHTGRDGGDAVTTAVDGVFVQIGLLPNSDWVRGTLDLSDRGEIVVDGRCTTSIPGIVAAGDVTTVPFKQISVASGSGAISALAAFDHLIRTSVPEPISA